MRLIPLYQTNRFNKELVQEGEENLTSYFQSTGYFDAQVHTNINEESKGTTVLYTIRGDKGAEYLDSAPSHNQSDLRFSK